MGEVIVEHAKERGLSLGKPKSFEAIAGHGLVATLGEQEILVGNLKLMKRYQIDAEDMKEKAEALADEGKTLMYVAIERQLAGIIAVADILN